MSEARSARYCWPPLQLSFGVSWQQVLVKYKNLKSIAHNFGHSFTSDMNWALDDYVMNHLARAAISSGQTELHADLLAGTAEPPALAVPQVRMAVSDRRAMLAHLLGSQNAEPSRIRAATMRLRVDVARRSAHPSQPDIWEFPFECVVELTDDRGITHRGEVYDWWRAYSRTPAA